VFDLVAATGLPASHLSKHVQVLVWAGLLRAERSGRRVWLTPVSGAPEIEHIYASVLAMPDVSGELEADLLRFVKASPLT